jgi:hypothetical protein
MSGRFLSKVDMAEARRQMEIFNSRLNRGEIKRSEDILRIHHIVCGCGAQGCIFIHLSRKELDEKLKEVDLQ